MQGNGHEAHLTPQERLFLGVTEQLSRPFLQMARLAEVARSAAETDAHAHWDMVRIVAESSLQLAESYALSLRVQGRVTPLVLEPVTVSSLLYDTAQGLQPFARQYGVRLELETGPRSQPVMADRTVLQSAMTSLGQVFILAQSERDKPETVWLAAHKSRYGIVAGLYGESLEVGADNLRRARALHGKAHEPLQRLVSGPAAGVFVADSLLQTLASRLHVARYKGLGGLAATLQPSQQLQFI